ncbi:MAG TPA: helix-turn-helix transcriptional regulator [Thermoanaerobaculia bacterium]|nr:helix-turn-helix transcriptional regulator [Thermoanaerobaculia bacterium]
MTETVDPGSGSVFVDLGFADADERRLHVQLAVRINELTSARGLTQARTAELFGISQLHASDLKNYKLSRFSSERLLHFMTLLDRDVEIGGATLTPREALALLKSVEAPVAPLEVMIEESISGRYSES